MFAAVMPGLSQSLSPTLAMLSLAFLAGLYILPKLPKRVVVAATVAVLLASGVVFAIEPPDGTWEHCDPWWLLMFFICI